MGKMSLLDALLPWRAFKEAARLNMERRTQGYPSEQNAHIDKLTASFRLSCVRAVSGTLTWLIFGGGVVGNLMPDREVRPAVAPVSARAQVPSVGRLDSEENIKRELERIGFSEDRIEKLLAGFNLDDDQTHSQVGDIPTLIRGLEILAIPEFFKKELGDDVSEDEGLYDDLKEFYRQKALPVVMKKRVGADGKAVVVSERPSNLAQGEFIICETCPNHLNDERLKWLVANKMPFFIPGESFLLLPKFKASANGRVNYSSDDFGLYVSALVRAKTFLERGEVDYLAFGPYRESIANQSNVSGNLSRLVEWANNSRPFPETIWRRGLVADGPDFERRVYVAVICLLSSDKLNPAARDALEKIAENPHVYIKGSN